MKANEERREARRDAIKRREARDGAKRATRDEATKRVIPTERWEAIYDAMET